VRNREGWKNERINKKNSKPECSPFILDILMIILLGTEDNSGFALTSGICSLSGTSHGIACTI
jgi:hypothetical protein